MGTNCNILIFSFLLIICNLQAQSDSTGLNDSLIFKGQLSIYAHYNANNNLPFWTGGRYIPQLN